MAKVDDSKLGVGIIGTGFGSVVQFPGFKTHPLFEPIALVGQHKSKTRKIANRLEVKISSTDWRDLLSNDDIDVISIATPPNLHKEIAIEAFKAGKHVLCEKPLALNYNDALEMKTEADDSGLVAMIDFEFRYIPTRAYFVDLIKNGYLGEIYQFDITVRNPSRLNPRSRGYNWWSDKSAGGGILGALGSHYIDLLHQLFGEIQGVCGRTSVHIPKRLNKLTGKMRKVSADDSFTAMFDLGGSTLSHMMVSTTNGFGRGSRIEAYGSEGTLILNEEHKLLGGKIGEDQILKQLPIPQTHQISKTNGEHNLISPFKRLLDEFAKGVKRGTSPSPNFDDGVKIQEIIDAIKKSQKLNRWVVFK